MASLKSTGPHPSPPPTPKPLLEVPHGLLANPSSHADSLISKFPLPPVPTKNPPRQQQYSPGLNETQASRLANLDISEPHTGTYVVASHQSNPHIHTLPQRYPSGTTTGPVQPRPKALYSPTPSHPQPYYYPRTGPSPSYPDVPSTGTEHSSLLSYQDSLLLHPIGHNSRSVTTAGMPPTTSERPMINFQVGSGQRGYSPQRSLSPNYQQSFRSNNINDKGSSAYPSPLSSGSSQLAPSPSGWTSPSLDQNFVLGPFHSHNYGTSPPNVPLPASPSSGFQDHSRPASNLSGLGSSGPPQSPNSSEPASSPKPAFVFPGSRSTARPKVSAKTGTPQKIKPPKGKKNGKDREDQVTSKQPNLHLSRSHELSPPPTRIDPISSNAATDVTRPRASSSVTTQTATSSNSSSSDNQSQGFVYPSSRSTAHPRREPLLGRKKDSVADANAERRGKPKFLGLGIWSNRKKRGSMASYDGPSYSGRSSESSNGTLHVIGPTSAESETATVRSGGSSVRDGEAREESGNGEGRLTPTPYLLSPGVGLNERRKQWKGKGNFRSYPLDPYDSVLLDNDRQTGGLLRKLNRTNAPSFHNYGNLPPRSVLDLGCGQGHWALEAAMAWKRYGTRITGFDMVDIMKSTRAQAVNQGVADNITFVRGSFLEERLPFHDGSFDFVRMSCLALCIPSDAWEGVLREVFRVLILGGRLELIDDHIFFPYAKSPSLPTALSNGESITSGVLASYGPLDRGKTPTRGIYDDETSETDTSTLHDAPHEREFSTATLDPQGVSHLSEWHEQQVVSKDLEVLFENLLVQKYGIHANPSSFILKMLKEVSGHAREIATMHLTLAPPNAGTPPGKGQPHKPVTDAFMNCPGLILWPSTLIPMSPAEIEAHASKHLKMLLSCKNDLVKHAVEVTKHEGIDEESISEAVWEYENFLSQRFYPPPGADPEMLDSRSPTPQGFERRRPSHQFNPSSSRISVVSGISVSTENRDAMLEYQSDFRQHFAWSSETVDSRDTPPESPILGLASGLMPPSPRPVINREGAPSPASTIAPPYSPIELTHVRTFRVFEAIKLNDMAHGPLSGSSS